MHLADTSTKVILHSGSRHLIIYQMLLLMMMILIIIPLILYVLLTYKQYC